MRIQIQPEKPKLKLIDNPWCDLLSKFTEDVWMDIMDEKLVFTGKFSPEKKVVSPGLIGGLVISIGFFVWLFFFSI